MIASSAARAANIYVDNRLGNDAFNGSVAIPQGALTGPVRTIGRGIALADRGDHIVIAKGSLPYFESISLSGPRSSGYPTVPFTIEGNGAILCGLRRVPAGGWERVSDDVWKLSLTKGTFIQLFREREQLQQLTIEQPLSLTERVDQLEPGQYLLNGQRVYYRQQAATEPARERFDFAADSVGVTLHNVRHIEIKDLTIFGFRVDGIHAQNLCDDVRLTNIQLHANGRSGLAATGSTTVTNSNVTFAENGVTEAVISRPAKVYVEETADEPEAAE